MRFFSVLVLLFISSYCFSTSTDSTNAYQIIGDSVFLADGSACHIDNFANGTCETEEAWWGFNFFNFWIGLLIPFVFFGYIIFTIKRKMRKR